MVTLLVGRSPLYTAPAQGEAPASRATIADHVRFLAGDKIRDRIVGRPGIELAARYVADAFKADGLQPGGDDGSYVQVLNATVPPRKTAVQTKNVIGIVPGAGSLAGEYVVIGAHYDSAVIGLDSLKMWAKMYPGVKAAFKGADDNASGTAALIELAKRLANCSRDIGPRRSALLIAFTGEEVGAFGSKYFAEHPTVPLDKITAMVNLDTIGRMEGGRVDVYGVKSGVEFHDLMMDVGRELGLSIIDEPKKGHERPTSSTSATASPATSVFLYGGLGIAYQTPFYRDGGGSRNKSLVVSDDVPFFRKRIPILFFSTGKRGHTPDDNLDHLNIDGIQRVVEIVHSLADKLLHRPLRVTFEGRIPGEY